MPGAFKEDLHPRGGKGSAAGGKFVAKGGGGGAAKTKPIKAVKAKAPKLKSTKLSSPLTAVEVQAVQTLIADKELNNRLHSGTAPKAGDEQLTGAVDAAIAKSTLKEVKGRVVSYRKISPEAAKQFADMKPGDIVTSSGYTSTQLAPPPLKNEGEVGWRKGGWMAINGAEGQHGLDPTGQEAELLFARGAKLQFSGLDGNGDHTFTIVDDGTGASAKDLAAQQDKKRLAKEAAEQAKIDKQRAEAKLAATKAEPISDSVSSELEDYKTGWGNGEPPVKAGASMTLEEDNTNAILGYAGTEDGVPLNKALRKGKLTKDQAEVVANFDKVFPQSQLAQDTLLFRTVSPDFALKLAGMKVGEVVTDAAYCSTTYAPETWGPDYDWTMKIMAPEGSQVVVVPMEYEAEAEREAVLPRDSGLEFMGHDPEDGKLVFKLSQPSDGPRHKVTSGDFTKEQVAAIESYISDDPYTNGVALNGALRDGETLSPEQEDTVKHLDSAIQASPPTEKEVVVYRGTPHDFGTGKDKAYTSVSSDREEASKFATDISEDGTGHVYAITVPAGAHMLDLSKFTSQKEYLLARNSSFKEIGTPVTKGAITYHKVRLTK